MTAARIGRERMKDNIVNKPAIVFALRRAFEPGGGASEAAVLSAIFVGCGGASVGGAATGGVDFSSAVVVTTTVSAMSVKTVQVGGNKCGINLCMQNYVFYQVSCQVFFQRNPWLDQKYLGKIRNYRLTLIFPGFIPVPPLRFGAKKFFPSQFGKLTSDSFK